MLHPHIIPIDIEGWLVLSYSKSYHVTLPLRSEVKLDKYAIVNSFAVRDAARRITRGGNCLNLIIISNCKWITMLLAKAHLDFSLGTSRINYKVNWLYKSPLWCSEVSVRDCEQAIGSSFSWHFCSKLSSVADSGLHLEARCKIQQNCLNNGHMPSYATTVSPSATNCMQDTRFYLQHDSSESPWILSPRMSHYWRDDVSVLLFQLWSSAPQRTPRNAACRWNYVRKYYFYFNATYCSIKSSMGNRRLLYIGAIVWCSATQMVVYRLLPICGEFPGNE